jgi:mRNA-degrading endonuclease RelE of RelBE toxin-antitoxin system
MNIPTFRVEFTERAFVHLESFRKFERNIILDAVKAQLPYQPTEETRNRKLLRDNPLADWELRIQHYRVFYEVDAARHLVRIVAIGHKEHNTLFLGGEEITL